MRLPHCEECLSRRGMLTLVWATSCERCGHVPVVQLSPREIRLCLGGQP
jgi:hypothetical protein